MRLVLASTSPRRKELLALLHVAFEVADPPFEEQPSERLGPEEQSLSFAEGKARSCAGMFPNGLILAGDTLIELDRAILGKPADARESAAMLRRLRGRTHMVHTAVALYRPADHLMHKGIETVRVAMRNFDEAELKAYVRSHEGMGKAGAYSIQGLGGHLIKQIDGDYPAVVGLPLRLVVALLQRVGVMVPIDIDQLYRERPYSNWKKFASDEKPS